ncbi:MAG: uridine kinase [Flammeovirgaceae bacterium]|nr:uridine kinase [Flammeovirgaceae bacterium]|tara:strand:+ start:343 stop:963 length:621 start_codon:yes stop_codon:yes gene_type:complete
MDNKLFGISGSSGSGKSFIVKFLKSSLGPEILSVIYHDNYYKKREDQEKDRQGNYNFDLPSSFHQDELVEDLIKIKSGKSIIRKEYTFNNPKINPRSLRVEPKPIVIVEGLFLFNDPNISKFLDKKIFIDCDLNVMIDRRITRDHEKRGYDKSDVLYKYNNHVLPAFNKFILPHKDKSDLIVNNSKNNNSAPEAILEYIIKESGIN